MAGSRLALALRRGLELPVGRLAVFEPFAGYDLAGLSGAEVICRHFPVAQHFERAGMPTVREESGRYAAALVVLPRAKAEARDLIARAAAVCDGLVIVDGHKQDGVASIHADIRKRVPLLGDLSKAHGRIFWFEPGDFADWRGAGQAFDGFRTAPGVFSADAPDPGSVALVQALPELSGRVLDLGAGWGFLARHALQNARVSAVDLVEADHVALTCARDNVPDARAQLHWADAVNFTANPYDYVISNPPFHAGRAGVPELGRVFIATAARLLKPGGEFWMVANRHLPYEADLERRFGRVDEMPGTPAFKIFRATGARKQRRG
ncbi:MAG: MFS transporter [Rhodobacterales bacterium]|nr:MAG: MFS transporter [Rhodobacterales bacterium]